MGSSGAVDLFARALAFFVSSAQEAASRSRVVVLLSCNSASARRELFTMSVERCTIGVDRVQVRLNVDIVPPFGCHWQAASR